MTDTSYHTCTKNSFTNANIVLVKVSGVIAVEGSGYFRTQFAERGLVLDKTKAFVRMPARFVDNVSKINNS